MYPQGDHRTSVECVPACHSEPQVTVVGLTIWFDIHALTINTTNTLDEGIPRHTAALKGIHQVTDAFGYGSVDNTRVLLVPRMGVSALSDEAFTAAANTVQAIVADPKVTDTLATDFMSVAFAGVSGHFESAGHPAVLLCPLCS